MNASEKQLLEFLESRVGNKIKLSLKPQGDETLISEEAKNICRVSVSSERVSPAREYTFGGISEPFFDEMFKLFEEDLAEEE